MTVGMPLVIDDDSIEAIAQRVAELLRGESVAGEWVDAAEIARRFGVSRDFVYAHKARLGGAPLSEPGDRRKPRWRFDPVKVAEELGPRPFPAEPQRPPTKRSGARTERVDLLPVGRPE